MLVIPNRCYGMSFSILYFGPIKAHARYASSTGDNIFGTNGRFQQKWFDLWMEWFQSRTDALLFKWGFQRSQVVQPALVRRFVEPWSSENETYVSREHGYPLVDGLTPSVSFALVETRYQGKPFTGKFDQNMKSIAFWKYANFQIATQILIIHNGHVKTSK